MFIKRINHLGIASSDPARSAKVFELLGLLKAGEHSVPTQKLDASFYPIGESRLEFLKPWSEDTVVGKFMSKRGQGIHHLCVEVDDIRACLAKLKEAQVELLNPEPIVGAEGDWVAFIHPKAAGGILLELQQTLEHKQPHS